ncbi:hypothetical protein ACFVJS_05835 [Nocardioides sp. NPDC057772]
MRSSSAAVRASAQARAYASSTRRNVVSVSTIAGDPATTGPDP